MRHNANRNIVQPSKTLKNDLGLVILKKLTKTILMFSLSFDSKKSEVLMLKDLFVGALSSQRLLVSNFDDMTVTSMT